MIVWNSKTQRPRKNIIKKIKVRPMKPYMLQYFGELLNHYDWSSVLSADSVDEKVDEFLKVTQNMIEKHFPEKTIKLHDEDKFFITAKIKGLLRKRDKAYKQGKTFLFKSLRNQISSEIRNAKANFYNKNIRPTRDCNPSVWWKKIKKLTGIKKTPIILNDPETKSPMNDKDAANSINNFFASLTKDYPEIEDKWLEYDETDVLPIITLESVERKLSTLQTNKAPGPNDPHVKILKTFAKFFAIPLVDIFNKSFCSRTFPTIWKNFRISAIPKVDPCSTIDELRPISLTSVISKIQESYVVNWINEDIKGKISNAQYGGLPGSSAVNALIYLLHKWCKAMDTPGKVIRIVFLDFRKAFDLIDHNKLLENCNNIGIRPALMGWLGSYLNRRSQVTRFGNDTSDRVIISGGVPQGSRIGPVAFIVHINGLPSMIKETGLDSGSHGIFDDNEEDDIVLFMDDTTLSEVIDVRQHISGRAIGTAEYNMKKVMDFTKQQRMQLNLKKCKEMQIDFRRNKTILPQLKIEGNLFDKVSSYKLLGLWIDEDFKWNTNTDYIIKKAGKRLFLLKILKSYRAGEVDMKRFYISVIRPVLEYGAQVWNGSLTIEQSKNIERIQKRALGIIYSEYDYQRALQQANLKSLKDRRDQMCVDLIKRMSNPEHKLHHLLPRKIGQVRERETRLNGQNYYNFNVKTDRFRNSPIAYAIGKYNEHYVHD